MAKTIEQIENSLFDENDGNKFSKIKDKLIKDFSGTDREKVLEILIKYSKNGKILHWREFLLTDIIELVHEDETSYASYFEWAVTQPELAYWGIDGLLKIAGQKAFPTLIELAQNENISEEVRAKSIKSISVYSRQPFDRGLPEDPGHWKAGDFRISEILEWRKNGYKSGVRYAEPQVHATLKNPKTELEKIVAKLDKKLKVERKKQQDLSNPSNWLAVADGAKINEIEEKWRLPENYLVFLKNYSPIKVFIENDKFFQSLRLYGADELIESQAGYSFNAVTNETIKDWPPNFVVIADAGDDPYCMDIGNIKNNDAPIYTAMHGTGKWEFKKYTDSFIGFLKDITGTR